MEMNHGCCGSTASHGDNSQIVCDVTNCVYHDEGHKCNASQIMVGPSYAISSADTVCATFKSK